MRRKALGKRTFFSGASFNLLPPKPGWQHKCLQRSQEENNVLTMLSLQRPSWPCRRESSPGQLPFLPPALPFASWMMSCSLIQVDGTGKAMGFDDIWVAPFVCGSGDPITLARKTWSQQGCREVCHSHDLREHILCEDAIWDLGCWHNQWKVGHPHL